MFRIWGRTFKNNKMIKNTTIEIDNPEMTRTHKVFKALEDICEEFDLSNPIWLDNNIDEFKRISRTRFYQDSFIEHIDFDYLEKKLSNPLTTMTDTEGIFIYYLNLPDITRIAPCYLIIKVFSVILLSCLHNPVFQVMQTYSSCSFLHPAD